MFALRSIVQGGKFFKEINRDEFFHVQENS